MQMQELVEEGGNVVLNPALLPAGLTQGEYMKICFAMIDVAAKVVFLDGWRDSLGAKLEHQYCLYCGKKWIDLAV
jgi:hypothetical protein